MSSATHKGNLVDSVMFVSLTPNEFPFLGGQTSYNFIFHMCYRKQNKTTPKQTKKTQQKQILLKTQLYSTFPPWGKDESTNNIWQMLATLF